MFQNKIKSSLYTLLIVFLAWLGIIQLQAEDVTVTGTLPTLFTDGTTIPPGDLASSRIYSNLNGGAYSLLTTLPINPGDTTINFVDQSVATGLHCYQADVVRTNGISSTLSNEACKLVDVRIPEPVTLTIAN